MNTLLIQNFDQFLDALNNCELGIFDYEEVFESAQIETSELDKYIFWNDEEPSITEVMERGNFEVKVICWKPNQSLARESKKDLVEWVYVAKGVLVTDLSSGSIKEKESLEVTTATQLKNGSNGELITVHMYARN